MLFLSRLSPLLLSAILALLLLPLSVESATQYALYNLPPFSVIFQTQHSPELESAMEQASENLLSETNGKDSSLSHPLRQITQTFLKENFDSRLLELITQETEQDPLQKYEWFDMYNHLVGVDIVVRMYLVEGSLLTSSSSTEDESNRRRLFQHVTIRAEMYGVVAFEEPSQANKFTKPSNEVVWQMFGDYMSEIFTLQRDEFLRELVQSTQELLHEISSLQVQVNVASTTNAPPMSTTYSNGWSERTEKALLTIMSLLALMALVYSLAYLRQRVRLYRIKQQYHTDGAARYPDDEEEEEEGDEYNFDVERKARPKRPTALSANDRSYSMDAVRHGPDVFHRSSVSGAMSVLESTDRYLSKHRPDLYDSSHALDNNNNSIQVFGREYTIPSNPLDYIYSTFSSSSSSTAFMASPQTAFAPPPPHHQQQRRTSSMSIIHPDQQLKENIAARPFDEDADDEDVVRMENQRYNDEDWIYSSEQHSYRPISTIWRHLASMWDYDNSVLRPRSTDDGIMLQTPQASRDMELQTVQFYQDNPEDYDFAFKDFPRHDGTPCLIFNEDGAMLTHKQLQVFEIGSPGKTEDIDLGSTSNNEPVSDADFCRMLAQQGQGHSHHHHQQHLSPESSNSWVGNESVFYDEPPSDSASVASSCVSVAKSSSFKEQLGRLMQQKHRQYEKKAIVEKHQEKRAKERKTLREQERREKHKAMERQIEDMEAAFGVKKTMSASPSLSKLQKSPKPNSNSIGRYNSNNSIGSTGRYNSNNSIGSTSGNNRWATGHYQSPNPYATAAVAAAATRYSPKPGASTTTSLTSLFIPPTASASPFRQASPRSLATSRPSPSHPSTTRPKSNSPDHEQRIHSSSASSQRSISPPEGMEDNDNDIKPFRMRPRTTHPPPGGATAPTDLYVDTYRNYNINNNGGGGMDYSTLDKLSMPPMIDVTSSIGSNSSSKKYPSPNSVLDDFFGGAPTSISRKKTGSSNSSVGAPPKSAGSSMQQHRRVNSLEKEVMIRPVPQQRRRNNNNAKNHQHPQRAMTPTRLGTREDVRTTLDGGMLRASTPTRSIGRSSMPARPLTPMTHYNMQQKRQSDPIGAGSSGFGYRSGSNPRPGRRRSSGGASSSYQEASNDSSSSSLSLMRGGVTTTAEDQILSHGIPSSARYI